MSWRILIIMLVTALSGCALDGVKQTTPPLPDAQSAVEPGITPSVAPPPEEVAILVSSDIPAYREVADAVAARLAGRSKSWYLRGANQDARRAIEEIEHSERQAVVAIGLDAAIAGKELRGKKVVFCQVFNYEDDRLISATMKGVGMLPSFEKSFAAWRTISPELKRIGIITGPHLQEQVRAATAAAKKYGITIIHSEVSSDKEFLMVYKTMAGKVQGYWLWPDNRILSTAVLRDVMTFSVRAGKQVLVFNDDLLAVGGLLSITSDHRDIANQVLERLRQSEGKNTVPGSSIELLDAANLRVNPMMAKRLGLEIPEQYRKYSYGQ